MSGGHSKKRAPLNDENGVQKTAFTTASSTYSRQPISRNNVPTQPRPASPPASTYFSGFTGPYDEPLPTAGAQAHFAYSTTLRRHHVDGVVSPDRPGFGPLQPLVSTVEEAGGWLRRQTDGARGDASHEGALENGWVGSSHSHQPQRETPSAKYAHLPVEDALHDFQTSPVAGLTSSVVPALQAVHGYNEFSVQTPEPLLIKFAKTIYESPLILLLFGSAIVSAVMGNIDDAVSITIAILIVLTGVYHCLLVEPFLNPIPQSGLCRNEGPKNPSRHSTNLSPITAISFEILTPIIYWPTNLFREIL